MNDICSPPNLPSAGQRHYWCGLNHSAAAFVVANSISKNSSSSLLIAANVAEAERLYNEICALSPEQSKKTFLFPDWETLPYDSFSPHQDIVSDRLRCLYELAFRDNVTVIAAAQTITQRLVPEDYLSAKSLVVESGETIARESLSEKLLKSGYDRVDSVYQHGEFAVRGSLVDIWPMGSNKGFRLEFFDDEINSLRTFDPETQRSIKPVDKIDLLPGRECPLDDEAISRFKNNWHSHFDVDHRQCTVYQDISVGVASAGIEYFLPLFFDHTACILDYLNQNAAVYMLPNVQDAIETYWREIEQRYTSRSGDITRPNLKPEDVFFPVDQLYSKLKRLRRIQILAEQSDGRAGAFNFETPALPQLDIDNHANNPMHRVEKFLADTKYRVLFCADSEGRREILKEHLEKIGVLPSEVGNVASFLNSSETMCISVTEIQQSFQSATSKVSIVSESSLFTNLVRQARRRKKTGVTDSDQIVKNLTELKMGSPVVHIEHGVGRYRGLQAISHSGQVEEFLTLEYANEAKLYVPVTSLHLINRYSGADEDLAPLHKLGSEQWSKAKRKAAEQVRDVAAELLNLYALRQARQGYSHQIEQDAYTRFSSEFPFEETPDQQAAIDAVREDMLSPQPMDRLVCGDVGFGKTEVAMRAAFIAVQNSKQIAVLVPTTLLAQQHYESFKDRFANWPVNIEVLSRFKTGKETQQIVKKIEAGGIDIVIGTHKLIGGEVKFKQLGLVIIDEEHRFGVRQKEALKAIRAEVDILNMTATPIPRTLNMAMSGIRDLSIIATPPAKRLSVKTFVLQHDSNTVKEAIQREIRRGGQVYYLHNEVKTIDKMAAEVQDLVPEARVQIGHGQMRERELEAVMSDFYHKRFNVLVCTTIIETGIDVPSANTIIIERADHFGLAQLHQLRGRVGRSHHQAFAYLLAPNKRNMTKDAIKRLDAIEEAQDLGAGFTLASHDLEIRGAGELLGDDQSGQMQAIGFSMYIDMLDRAVEAIREGKEWNVEQPFEHETETNLNIPALIPDDYLPDVTLRLSLYKRLSSCKKPADLERLQVEMIDRFGLLPDPVKNLFRITQLRMEAEKIGVVKIDANDKGGKLEFGSKTQVEPIAIVKLVQNEPQNYKLLGANRLQFDVESSNADERIKLVDKILRQLQKAA